MIFGPWESLNSNTLILLFLLSAIFIHKSLKHWSATVAYISCFLSAIFVMNNSIYRLSDLNLAIYLQSLSAQSVAISSVVIMAALHVNENHTLKTIARLNILNSLWVLLELFVRHNGYVSGGVLSNSSMNSSFIALTIPFLRNPFAISVCLLAIFAAQASVPILVLAAVVSGLIFSTNLLEKKQKLYALAIAIILIGSGAYFTPEFTNSSGRYEQWIASLQYFRKNVNPVWGSGNGTYYLLGALISQARGMTVEVWTFAHNDWLEILFSCGYLGLISCLNLFGTMLYFSRAKPALFSSICGLGVFACFNMPAQYVIVAFTATLMIKAALGCRDATDQDI